VALVNVWLGAGSDPYTVAGWWLRRRGAGRRACDLVGTLDEDLVLEFAAADIDRQVLTFGVQPETSPRPTAACSSRPTLFLDEGEPASLSPQRPPAGSSMWRRRRRTDDGAAPVTATAHRRLRGVTNRLKHRRGQQTQHPGDHPATAPADPIQTVRGMERRAPSR
jgi:hypothetical protein